MSILRGTVLRKEEVSNECKEELSVKCYEIDMETTNLPFEDNSFDKVYSISTSWCLLNLKGVLSEMVRVMKGLKYECSFCLFSN